MLVEHKAKHRFPASLSIALSTEYREFTAVWRRLDLLVLVQYTYDRKVVIFTNAPHPMMQSEPCVDGIDVRQINLCLAWDDFVAVGSAAHDERLGALGLFHDGFESPPRSTQSAADMLLPGLGQTPRIELRRVADEDFLASRSSNYWFQTTHAIDLT